MRKRKNRRNKFTMKRERKSVVMLTPCEDSVMAQFAISMTNLFIHTRSVSPNGMESLCWKALGTSILPKGRQDLADAALEDGATHLLWIDSDMKFPADMVLRFLRYDEPIVGINAMARRPPYHNCAQRSDGTGLTTTRESTGLEKVERCGLGVLWVAAKVFAEMERPFFDFVYEPDAPPGQRWLGEDFYFFQKAHALGFDVCIDHDLSKEVLHMGAFGFNPMLAPMLLGAK